MAYKVVNKIYNVTTRVKKSANTYLIDGDSEMALIDPGWYPEGLADTLRQIKNLGLDVNKVKKILLTHCMCDHAGATALARKVLRAEVFIHRNEKDVLEKGDSILSCSKCIGHKLDFSFPPCKVDGLLKDKMIIPIGKLAIKVIHSPGHSPGCVIFLIATHKKVAITGDVIFNSLYGQNGIYWGWLDPHWGTNFEDYLNTFRRLSKVKADIVLPGHGGIFYDLSNVARKARKRFKERIQFPYGY